MQQVSSGAQLSVENVGGIDEARVTIEPGVAVLAGRNATNRTSLLRALMAVLGSDDTSLKADADRGRVELQLNGDRYVRTLERRDSGVVLDGDPYLADPTVADLFAFLLESNEARRAVARGDDLYELLMRPVDTEAIEAEIRRLQSERDDIDDELAAIDEKKRRLPELETERSELADEIAEKRAELEGIESEIDAADVDPERRQDEKQELERRLEDLRARRSDLETVRHRIDTERESVESLREERAELEAELDDLEGDADADPESVEAELDRLRSEKSEIESEITDLQNVIGFNDDLLNERSITVVDGGDDGAVTDELLPDQSTVTCWTCGSEVDPERIEDTIDRLRDGLEEKLAASRELDSRIDDLTDQKRKIEQRRSRRETVEGKIDSTEREIEERNERIEELKRRREELSESVEELEADVESLESEEFEEVLELHRRANRVEFELEQVEAEREEVEAEIESIEARLDEADELRDRRDAIVEDLEECRTRVERLERDAIEAFNDHMDTLLEVLDYDNVARIWIERTEETVRRGREKATESTFDLHVVRQTESGKTYEDTVDHLSESEREVTGLVFALAGYLVHDVHEEVPFMLLDSLEAIDAERIAAVVDHFREYTDYLVVALLEEDAEALGNSDVDAVVTEF